MKSSVQKKVISIIIFISLLVYGISVFAENIATESQSASASYVGLDASYSRQETEAEPRKLTIALIATDGFESVPGFRAALQALLWAGEMSAIDIEVVGPTANKNDNLLYPLKKQTEFGIVDFELTSTNDSQNTNKFSLLKLQKKQEQTLVLLGHSEPVESKEDWRKQISSGWHEKPVAFVALQPDAITAETFVTNVAPFLLPPEPEIVAEEITHPEEAADEAETMPEAEIETEDEVPEAALAQLVMVNIPSGKDCMDFLMTDVFYGTGKANVLKAVSNGNILYFDIPYSQMEEEPLLYIEADQIAGGITLIAPDGTEYLILGSEDLENASEESDEEPVAEEEPQTIPEEEKTAVVLKSRTILCDAEEQPEENNDEPAPAKKGVLVRLPKVDYGLVSYCWTISAPNSQSVSARLFYVPVENIDNNLVLTSQIEAYAKTESDEGEECILSEKLSCTESELGLVVESPLAKHQPITFYLDQKSAKLMHFLLANEGASVNATLYGTNEDFQAQPVPFSAETLTFTIPSIDRQGDYFIEFELVKGEETVASQRIHFSVENNSPVKLDVIQTEIVCWETQSNHTQIIDLKGKFFDLDNDELAFSFEVSEEEPLKLEYDEETQQLSIVLSGTPSPAVPLKIVVSDGEAAVEETLTLEYYSLEGILNKLKPESKLEETAFLRNTQANVRVSLTGKQENHEKSVQEFIVQNLTAELKVFHFENGEKGEQYGDALPLVIDKETLQFIGDIVLPNEDGKFAVYVTLQMDNDNLKWTSEEFKLDEFDCFNNPPKIRKEADAEPQKHIVRPESIVTLDITKWPERAYDDEGETLFYVLRAERKEKKEWIEVTIDENGFVGDKAGSAAIFAVDELPSQISFPDFGTYRISFRAQDDLGSTSKESVNAEIKISNLYVLIAIAAAVLLVLIIVACVVAYVMKPAYASDDTITLSLTDADGTESHTVELHSLKKKELALSSLVPMFHEKPLTPPEWNAIKEIIVKPGKDGIVVLNGKKKMNSKDSTISVCESITLKKKQQKSSW